MRLTSARSRSDNFARTHPAGEHRTDMSWLVPLLQILIGTATLVLYMKRHGNRNDFLAAAASLPGLAIFGGVLIPAQNVVADPTAAAGRVAENLEVIRLWHYPLAAFIAVAVYFSARAQQAGLGGRPKND